MAGTELIDEFTRLQDESQRVLAILYKVVLELDPTVKNQPCVPESRLVVHPPRVLPYTRHA
jgi:hypothetical protein